MICITVKLEEYKIKTEENAEDRINSIRQILERMFNKLSELNIIPKEIKENKGWINGSSLFLSNKHNEYQHLDSFIYPLVAFNLYHLLQVLQDASHDDENLKLKTVQYFKGLNNDYLYKSCIYSFFDIIVWFKNFIDQNSNADENSKLWEKNVYSNKIDNLDSDFIKGKVININKEKGFAFFKPDEGGDNIFIPPNLVSDFSLSYESYIQVKYEKYFDSRTNDNKERVSTIIKLD